MSVALARRLVWDSLVSPEEIQRALHVHVTQRAPLLRVLAQTSPELIDRVERELFGGDTGDAPAVLPDLDLLRELPPGLAAFAIALPVGRDAVTNRIRVLAADPTDQALRDELEFHFHAGVDLVGAPLRVLFAALHAMPDLKSRPPPPRTLDARNAPPKPRRGDVAAGPREPMPSEPPIPLVRVTPEHAAPPRTVKGVAPQGVSSGDRPAAPVVVARSGASRFEPVIELPRSRVRVHEQPAAAGPPAPEALDGSSGPPIETVELDSFSLESLAPGTLHGVAPAPQPSAEVTADVQPTSDSLNVALTELAAATSADGVVRVLARALARWAPRTIVFAVRGKGFEAKEAGSDDLRDRMKGLVIPGDLPSVLLTAVQTGQYVGPIPGTTVHQTLAVLLGAEVREIAVGAATVTGRAALVYVIGDRRIGAPLAQHAERLTTAASRALERIVRTRKK